MVELLKSLFSHLFRASKADQTIGEPATEAPPETGQLYSFRTKPLSEFSPQDTGRYAVFKALASNEQQVVLAVLDGIWTSPPTLRDAETLVVLHEHRFAYRGQPAVFGTQTAWWVPADLEDLRLLGRRRVSQKEAKLAGTIIHHRAGARYATPRSVNLIAEGEWRWKHDRKALIEENERREAKDAAIRAAQEERYRDRLSGLSWDQLLAETPFERWSPSPPFPPAEFVFEARKTILDACLSLQAMGPKPRKAQVRAVLKRCVEWFNDADERAGGVIETEEREDICAILEEMAFVARQKSLVGEIDEWRDW